MTAQHQCPLCGSPLWPHVHEGQRGWFCRHCEQTVPYSVDTPQKNTENHPLQDLSLSLGETGWMTNPKSKDYQPFHGTAIIPHPLTLRNIFQVTVQQISQFLQVDRVVIVKRMPSGEMIITEEWRQRPWKTLLHCKVSQFVSFSDINAWQQGKIEAIANTQQATSSMMAFDSLFDVKAKVTIPILQSHLQTPQINQVLWGLLIVHQCSQARQWTATEIDLLSLSASQIAISIQQDNIYQYLNEINQKLEEIAFLDGLTQVANRHYFQHYFDQEWRRMTREQKPLSLILCDVDFFKRYNDTYGHLEGDRCLQEIARVLNNVSRRPGDLVARYGGEEFAILLPNTQVSGAVYIAEQIRTAVKGLKLANAPEQHNELITVSLGVSGLMPSLEMSSQQLLKQADQALYDAKRYGRDLVVSYEKNKSFLT